ncbi:MAG: glycosyltransferase [Phycisphaerales bacterium]|nr:glycosyltransferase [Phycisphaerales bacterium]
MSDLRITMLAHNLRVAGGAVVGKNLLKAIAALAPQHTYQISIPDDPDYREIVAAFPNCEPVVFRASGGVIRRTLYERREIAQTVRGFRPDVVFGMGGVGLDNPPCPQALYVQDAHYFYPSKYFAMESARRRMVKAYHKWTLGRQLRKTALLLCQTPVAVERLRTTFSFVPRIEICPNAVTTFAEKTGDTTAAADRLDALESRFKLFYLTKYYPHKNLEGIVDMFDRFRSELDDVAAVITVAPDQHSKAPGFIDSIARRGLSDRIVNVGPLKQQELGAYYTYCDALLMPTFLESFSGTYLEAMHFGTPILTSDLDFARGICGDAAVYFDPWDPSAMKDAVLKLKADAALQKELIHKGNARLASMYAGWDRIAADLMAKLVSLASVASAPHSNRGP